MSGAVVGNTSAQNWILLTYTAGFTWKEVQADMEAMLTEGLGYVWRAFQAVPGGGLAVVYAATVGGS